MWASQQFYKEGLRRGIENELLDNAFKVGELTLKANLHLPPIFSLKHLAVLSGVKYGFLRSVVDCSVAKPYRVFKIKKRSSCNGKKRFRVICVPSHDLLKVQRWIAKNILSYVNTHSASVAYAKGNSILAGAKIHCKCRWLIKIDIVNFFESINEISVYRVFLSLGYQPLVAFEMTRICTRKRARNSGAHKWRAYFREETPYKNSYNMGYLPQGAPTSPMLANLAMRNFDDEVGKIAMYSGLFYTRYADDLVFSADDKSFSRDRAKKIIKKIYGEIRRRGFFPNLAKTKISSPGARKVVLGLLVDGGQPKLTREFKSNIRRHLYYLQKDIASHIEVRKFSSTIGIKNHVQGLVAYACQIEPKYGGLCKEAFDKIKWSEISG